MKEEVNPPLPKRPPLRHGIPTMYADLIMRSRTEARWAALFDAIGWDWEYEPYELEGWIPDFLVRLPKMDFLVEIKSTSEDFFAAQQKINRTSYEGIALVVGQGLDGEVLGFIREPDGPGFMWSEADVYFCLNCGKISIRPAAHNWFCRQCGNGHGKTHIGHYDIQSTFKRCTNRTQWQPEELYR